MRTENLQNLAEIIAGFTFRMALKEDKKGKTKVLLTKKINEDGSVDPPGLIINQIPNTNAYVQKNDVLLSSRGIFRAGVVEKDMHNTLATSSIYILRIKNTNIIPHFLAIYLNSEQGQARIKKILTGSSIQTINRKPLEELDVPVPSLETQQRIIDINCNWNKRQKLLTKKIQLSKNIAEGTIKQLITTNHA